MESYFLKLNKVVEYKERNLRPFLFTESLQIIQTNLSRLVPGPLLCTLLFSSAHRFRSGDLNGHGRSLILCSVNHFCVDLDVCFESLSCWKIQQ